VREIEVYIPVSLGSMFASFLTPLDSDQVPSGDLFLLAIVITYTMPIMMSSFCRSPTAWWSSAGVQLEFEFESELAPISRAGEHLWCRQP
jgi:hypothetical protein